MDKCFFSFPEVVYQKVNYSEILRDVHESFQMITRSNGFVGATSFDKDYDYYDCVSTFFVALLPSSLLHITVQPEEAIFKSVQTIVLLY